MCPQDRSESEETPGAETEEFGSLLRFTVLGYVAGLALGTVLDRLGLQLSAVGQWAVRTVAGEGESIFEGAFAILRRLRRSADSMAEAYGWGKLFGMMVPWVIDWGSRLAGIDVYGVPGFYIPFFYSMGDQIGANVSGLAYLRRTSNDWSDAFARYLHSPIMMTSLGVIVLVPAGLLAARLLGFSPTTQTFTALETMAANLCWCPPLVGWLAERRAQRS